MTLHSPTFLFLFLPVFLLVYGLAGTRFRNLVLLLFSLAFFVWSDPLYAPLIFVLTLFNLFAVVRIQKTVPASQSRSRSVAFAILLNCLVLLGFKILTVYGQEVLLLAGRWGIPSPGWVTAYLPMVSHIPLGLSFFTFQSVSLLVDTSRQQAPIEKPLMAVSNFLLMFPKAIAGPISNFREISASLQQRLFTPAQSAAGLRRFMLGFAKKALIADQLALITDQGIFSQPPASFTTATAWLVLVCYALQIYFDFSAYTDMAIGLGQVLGFHLPENFDQPYQSTSIAEFWRRWHITLSGWFRNYVFYPLERKRRSVRWLTQTTNILIVFLLTGLWHGITPPFIVWGLLHGSAIALERTAFGSWLASLWRPFQHVYALAVILVGWVFFRSPTIPYAWNYLKALAGFSHPAALPFSALPPISALTWAALAAGILLATPIVPMLGKRFPQLLCSMRPGNWDFLRQGLVVGLFLAAIIFQAATSFHPFIYGDF